MEDRITTIFDEKQRILDLTSYNFTPPSTGIYDGQVRYYKANLEWAKIIEGHVDWLAEVSAWKDAENEGGFPIQQILIFLEGVDEEMQDISEILERLEALEMALSQMCEDVKCGVIKGFEELAARVLLAANKDNVLSDIAIDKDDGTVTIENPPSQPPGNVDATTLELANGLTYAVGVGLREFFLELNTGYLDALDTGDMSAILRAIYDLNVPDDLLFQGAIADYWAAWNTGSQSYVPNAGKVSEFVWLYGASKKTLARYALYVQKEISLDVGAEVFAMVDFITDEQISIWYQSGQGQPRSDYVTYPDYRNEPTAVLIVTPADLFTGSATKEFNGVFGGLIPKDANNRWLIKASGLMTNTSLNRDLDACYEWTGSAWQYNQVTGLRSVGGDLSPEAQPARREDHNYNIYYTQSQANEYLSGFRYFNNLPLWTAGQVTGQLTFQLFDLGKA